MLEVVIMSMLEKLEDTQEVKNISREIFNDRAGINDDNVELVNEIFTLKSGAYFDLGFKACLSLMLEIVKKS